MTEVPGGRGATSPAGAFPTMNRLLRTALVPSLLLLAAGAVALFAMNRDATRAHAASVPDKPLPEYEAQLLELAFTSASAMPAKPHIRTRCRLQDDVVQALLALDAPHKALACAEKIEDWRRGLGYADFACYAARHGATEDVQHYLDLARKISEQGEPVISQDWQKGRIRVAIAKTHAWLGNAKESSEFETGIDDADRGRVDAVRALRADDTACDAQIDALRQSLASGDLDLSRNALATGALLFNRYFDDPTRRARAETLIESANTKLPLEIRFDHFMELASFAWEHKDAPAALRLADQAQALLDGVTWLPENYIPFASRLATLRFRAGATEQARASADAALALFDEKHASIVDIYCAGALRPLAETYAAMGDREKALSLYKRAVEESVRNPNSRPRVEDLIATCLSLAKNGIEPDAELKTRLEQVSKGLGTPW